MKKVKRKKRGKTKKREYVYSCNNCNTFYIEDKKKYGYKINTSMCKFCGGDIIKIESPQKKPTENNKNIEIILNPSKKELEKLYKKRGYSNKWTPEFRKSIRNIDNDKCIICGKTSKEERQTSSLWALSIHHIDENKKNLKVENLITICNYCHLQSIHSKHEYNKQKLIDLCEEKRSNLSSLLRIIEHKKKFNI